MGTLYIVSTPIGNLEDITIRAIRILLTTPVIACEDTRRTGQLLHHLRQHYATMNRIIEADKQKLISFYDEVEEKKTPEIISYLEQGISVALVSDAGTPLIADPGFRLVRACLKRNFVVTTVPGASSLLAALPLSGFPMNRFLFVGYLPTNEGKKKQFLTDLKKDFGDVSDSPTIVCFESSHRIVETLTQLAEAVGDIPVTIAKELTKLHEQVIHGTTGQIKLNVLDAKGEFVVMFRLLA